MKVLSKNIKKSFYATHYHLKTNDKYQASIKIDVIRITPVFFLRSFWLTTTLNRLITQKKYK